MATEVTVGRVRSVVLLILFSVLTVGLYYFVWLLVLNKETRGFSGKGAAPIWAPLLFLVPVLGWFVAVWLTARGVRRAQVFAGEPRLCGPIYPALFAALAPVVGWFIAMGYVQGAANRVWTNVTPVLEWAGRDATTFECPDCATRFPGFINPIVVHTIVCPNCQRSGTA